MTMKKILRTKRSPMKTLRLPLLLAVVMAASVFARADLVFLSGNNPQPDEHNILFNTGTDVGNSVLGSIVGFSPPFAQFTPGTSLTGEDANGQAVLTATSGLLTNVSFSLTSGTFTDFIFDATIPQGGGPPGSADLLTTAHENGGSASAGFLLGPGSNFFTIVAH